MSSKGARGRYQLMPATARFCNADPLITQQARRCAARLLRLHLRRWGRIDYALASYVAGAGAVRRWWERGQAWPASVERYVAAVMQRAGGVR